MDRIMKNTPAIVECERQILTNNQRIQEKGDSIREKMDLMKQKMREAQKQKLRKENANLLKLIENTKKELISLEIMNGKQQIAVPNQRNMHTEATNTLPVQEAPATSAPAEEKPQVQAKKKLKTPKEPKPGAAEAVAEIPVDVRRLDMRVGRILEIARHPDADSLYVEKIDCGEASPRTVVSGLVKHVSLEEMQNRMVVILCNLKPAKMRGIVSEAMVMCASTPERVEVLSPPAGAEVGDLVHCEGYPRQPDAQLNPKKKIFEACAPDLKTDSAAVACYRGASLHVPGKGNIVSQTLKNAPVK